MMSERDLAWNQTFHRLNNTDQIDLPIRRCSYCDVPLVRLRTVTRHFKVLHLQEDAIVWLDRYGMPQKAGILTWDHLMPRSKGGKGYAVKDELDVDLQHPNLIPSCLTCNLKKGDLVPTRLPDGCVQFIEADGTVMLETWLPIPDPCDLRLTQNTKDICDFR